MRVPDCPKYLYLFSDLRSQSYWYRERREKYPRCRHIVSTDIAIFLDIQATECWTYNPIYYCRIQLCKTKRSVTDQRFPRYPSCGISWLDPKRDYVIWNAIVRLPQISLFILRIDAMWVVFMSGKKGKVSALSDYRVHGHCDFVGIPAMYTECQRTKDYVL